MEHRGKRGWEPLVVVKPELGDPVAADLRPGSHAGQAGERSGKRDVEIKAGRGTGYRLPDIGEKANYKVVVAPV